MDCKHSCGIISCDLEQEAKRISSIPFSEFYSDDFSHIDVISKIHLQASRTQRNLCDLSSNFYLELRSHRVKFHPVSYFILNTKFQLWQSFIESLQNYLILVKSKGCDVYPDGVLYLVDVTAQHYESEISKVSHPTAELFLKSHSEVFKTFRSTVVNILQQPLPFPDILSMIGQALIGGMAYTGCEVASIQAILQGCHRIFCIAPMFDLNNTLNIFNLIPPLFPDINEFFVESLDNRPETLALAKYYAKVSDHADKVKFL